MRKLALLAVLIACLAACASGGGGPNDSRTCVTPPGSSVPWGYFPGYGCGPVTPARAGFWGFAAPEARDAPG